MKDHPITLVLLLGLLATGCAGPTTEGQKPTANVNAAYLTGTFSRVSVSDTKTTKIKFEITGTSTSLTINGSSEETKDGVANGSLTYALTAIQTVSTDGASEGIYVFETSNVATTGAFVGGLWSNGLFTKMSFSLSGDSVTIAGSDLKATQAAALGEVLGSSSIYTRE